MAFRLRFEVGLLRFGDRRDGVGLTLGGDAFGFRRVFRRRFLCRRRDLDADRVLFGFLLGPDDRDGLRAVRFSDLLDRDDVFLGPDLLGAGLVGFGAGF